MLRFGKSVVDVPTRSVEYDGEVQHLEPQAFDLLAYLLTHRDRVVSKTELLDEVWGDQFVSESALTTRIKEVRRAVGDDGTRQEVVKNFRGRGYRFVADVDDETGDVDDSVSGRVRRLATSLVGRDGDIEAVGRLLESANLVSLVGPGGVGKTSLARDVAALQRERYSDGVYPIRLASAREAQAIYHVLRRETGLEDAGATEADLISAIAGLDALLVFDNCEHVIAEVARLVGAITEIGGPVQILTTSRERLGVSAERVWPVEPLTEESARQLFIERMRSAQPEFDLPPGSENTVGELLTRLDRLPLAIEMAAGIAPTLGLDGVLTLVRDRLDLLRTSDRSASDRHRTVADLIGWSEELLDEQAREALTCLSTFAGPAIAPDIAAVAQVDATELLTGPLARCVDQSLVVVETVHQPATYRLLETVRASAARRRTAAHEARHAHRVIAIATEMDRVLRTPDEVVAAQRLDELIADMRVAHRWAREHDPERAGELSASLLHFAYERQWTEPMAWATQLLSALESDHPASFPAAASCASDAANRGDFERASALAQHAVSSSDPRVLASAYDTLTNVGLYNGDFVTAARHVAEQRTIAEATADAFVEANVTVDEAMLLAYGGEPGQALEYLTEHRRPASVSPTGAAWISYIEADVLAALGRTDEAIERFEHAQKLGTSVGSTFVRSVAELSALAARSRSGDPDEARVAFVPVLSHYRRVRSTTHAITALRNLVALLVRAGDDEHAMVLLGAVSSPDLKATFGAERDQLDDARATVEQRVDPDLVASWIAHGATHDPMWAVDHAISVLS